MSFVQITMTMTNYTSIMVSGWYYKLMALDESSKSPSCKSDSPTSTLSCKRL